MNRIARIALGIGLLTTLISSTQAHVDSWRSELYPENWKGIPAAGALFESDKFLQDFSYAGYMAGAAPIPEVAGPVFDVTSGDFGADPSGARDATAAIQAAIDQAGAQGGGVVFLPRGSYRLSLSEGANEALLITHPGVILRGEGPDKTFLLNTTTYMRQRTVITVRGPYESGFYHDGLAQVDITEDLLEPTLRIPVWSIRPFAVGDHVVVRQNTTDAWVQEHNEPGWLGDDRPDGLAYRRIVTAIDSQTAAIWIDAPIRYAVKMRDNARVHRLSAAPATGIGLEGFSIGNVEISKTTWGDHAFNTPGTGAFDAHQSYLIIMERLEDSWVRDVKSYRAAGNASTAHMLSGGISVRESRRVTIDNCVFQRPQYGGGGGNGYMFQLRHSSDCLIRDSVARWSRHGFMITRMGSSGNVIHGCLDADTGRSTGSSGLRWVNGSNSDHHGGFSHSNLIDVCIGDNSSWHASYRNVHPAYITAAHSVFWNTEGRGNETTAPIVRSEQARYGYVIGTRGSRSHVNLTPNFPARTNPVDHSEGIGQGNSLEPFSLYQDQIRRRLGPRASLVDTMDLPFPANAFEITPIGFAIGEQSVTAEEMEIRWEGPEGVTLEPQSGGGVRGTVPGPGDWELVCVVQSGHLTESYKVLVRAEDFTRKVLKTLEPVDDVYIQGGDNENVNYNHEDRLRLKRAGGPATTRRTLMRFDLSSLGDDVPVFAELILTAASELDDYDGWSIGVHPLLSSDWNERTVTWITAPGFGRVNKEYIPSPSLIDRIDLSELLLDAVSSNGHLELGLQAASQPDYSILTYHSREHNSAAVRPRLEITLIPSEVIYENWIRSWPGLAEDALGIGDDPDGDGVPHLIEMVLGRDPTKRGPGPPIEIVADRRVARIVLGANLPYGLVFRVERSSDLVEWEAIPLGVEAVQILGNGRREIEMPFMEGDGKERGFLRLRAELDLW